MNEYISGEVVEITIKDARVIRKAGPGYTAFDIDGHKVTLMTDLPSISVKRTAPADFPPLPGDVWRDGDGLLCLAAVYTPDYDDREDSRGINDDGWRVVLIPASLDESCKPGIALHRPEVVARKRGPLTLVHRETPEETDR